MAEKRNSKQASTSLIIDCQVFQTPSWHRGMGKYSKAFLEELLSSKELTSKCDLYFLFNKNIDINQEAIDFITVSQPSAPFIYADLAVPKEPRTDHSVAPVITQNKAVLNKLIEDKFAGDAPAFLILALYLDEVCSTFPDNASDKLLIYYDSIPYLYHERYGQFSGFFEHFYLPHTSTVYEATKLLTISKTVANDLHVMFGLPQEVIFNIDGASIPRPTDQATAPKDLDIAEDTFILVPTGQELRKNNLRAVRGFEQFRAQQGLDTKLVITSHFTEEMRSELSMISNYLVFTGNVTEGEILWLFQKCRFVLFPSEYEGLGLPILEAVDQGKPIACSDISVFREMSREAFSFFDPLNIDVIADTLTDIETNPSNQLQLKESYKKIITKYTWENTVKAFLKCLNVQEAEKTHKKKIAIFCPDVSGFSAIGKVITESHAWYARYFDITYYFDSGPNHEQMRPNLLAYLAPSYHIEQFTAEDASKYDALIYHIGNSEYHLNIIHTALAFPGYAILHDTYLDGAYANMIEQGYISRQRFELEKKLDKLLPDNNQEGLAVSSNLTSIVNSQIGIITHSEYAKNAAKRKLINPTTKVMKVNLPVDVPIFTDITRGIDRKLNVSFAGIIAKIKGTDIIENIALSEEFNDCNITIFGYASVEPERLEKLRSLPHVRLITNPSDHEFQTLISNTDVLINVRLAYKGETSLTTLEAMRYGAAVMVRDFGWYSELPGNAVVKVTDPSQAIVELHTLLQVPEQLKDIKEAALKHVRDNFSHKAYAEQTYMLITNTSKNEHDNLRT